VNSEDNRRAQAAFRDAQAAHNAYSTTAGVEPPLECDVCGMRCWAEERLAWHLKEEHKPYREPWWLRALRWIVQ
jgi:hypothetical protein